ncbi:uncharacterized protein RAG0_14245 [Rhynchosporium agropyri]|uniref:Uncharacterized protein n=1 Tax=Rhynchosporium agropyri TaxID=914238 RepID=A0A1E1LG38_9HELO|nr:uncharacterized protein RAG0_14245 [Rhynchosporium agropyri]
MAAKKILVGFRAAGVQGGSFVKAILRDAKRENWPVCGVTRDVSKPSSGALESLAAEAVAADLNNALILKLTLNNTSEILACQRPFSCPASTCRTFRNLSVKLAMTGLSVSQCLAPHPFHSSIPPTMLANEIVKQFKEKFPEAGKTGKAAEVPHQKKSSSRIGGSFRKLVTMVEEAWMRAIHLGR